VEDYSCNELTVERLF